MASLPICLGDCMTRVVTIGPDPRSIAMSETLVTEPLVERPIEQAGPCR